MTGRSRPLAGRRALVTGSTTGLGFSIANGLAAQGCDIVLNGLAPAEEAEAARREVERTHGVRAIFHGADLSRSTDIEDLVRESGCQLGGLDIVVNNAVVRQFGPIEQMAVAGWDHSLAVNLSAAFHTIRLTLAQMRERGFGRIVNMSSIYGLIGATNRADYVTTKTALIGLTRAVALEAAEYDITCNAICPGTVPKLPSRTRSARLLLLAGPQRAKRPPITSRRGRLRGVSLTPAVSPRWSPFSAVRAAATSPVPRYRSTGDGLSRDLRLSTCRH